MKTNREERVPKSVPRFASHVSLLLALPAKLCYELVVHSQSLAIVPFPKDGGEEEHGGEQTKRKVSLRFERSSFSPHFLFSSGFVFSFFFLDIFRLFFPPSGGPFSPRYPTNRRKEPFAYENGSYVREANVPK